jgi:hypothetical protein
MVRLMMSVVIVLTACGNVSRQQHDAGVVYDAAIDSPQPPPPADAMPDAPPLKETREFVNGGTRMMSSTYTFDIQVGHGMQQSKTAGATYQFEGNAAVKP